MRLSVVVLLLSCCSLPLKAKISPLEERVVDRSASIRSGGRGRALRSVMILPPSGSTRGDFDSYLHEFERAFLSSGIQVVSSAVTGRVVQERKNESAAQLSDLERALILAVETRADAVLQIGSLEVKGTRSRYLCGKTGESVADCSAADFDDSQFGRVLEGTNLVFQGRLIDVESGEVLVAIDLSAAVADQLEGVLASPDNEESKPRATCVRCVSGSWWCRKCAAAERRALSELIEALVQRVASQTVSAGTGKGVPAQQAPPAQL